MQIAAIKLVFTSATTSHAESELLPLVRAGAGGRFKVQVLHTHVREVILKIRQKLPEVIKI